MVEVFTRELCTVGPIPTFVTLANIKINADPVPSAVGHVITGGYNTAIRALSNEMVNMYRIRSLKISTLSDNTLENLRQPATKPI